jgi:hypothetical protein
MICKLQYKITKINLFRLFTLNLPVIFYRKEAHAANTLSPNYEQFSFFRLNLLSILPAAVQFLAIEQGVFTDFLMSYT